MKTMTGMWPFTYNRVEIRQKKPNNIKENLPYI